MVTDRDITLIKALSSFPQFRDSVNLLCKWYINQNVLAKYKYYFPPVKKVRKKIVKAFTFDIFLLEWKSFINFINEAIFW